MKVKTVSYLSPTAGRDFAESLRQTGFAVLSDHPIPAGLIADSFKEWEAFFASDTKLDYVFDPAKQSGYFPFRTENARNSTQKDLKEFFHYYPKSQLPPAARVFTPELRRALMTVASTLLRWVDENTPEKVRREFSMPLSQMIEDSHETLLRAIHYPPLTGAEEEGAVRAAAHEDINLITLLPAATAPGLQVQDVFGKWHDVSCDPGTIVVNSGDMLKAASGGYYPSTTHRVLNPTGPDAKRSRLSIPLFLHPRWDVMLAPDLTAGECLSQRLREIGLK